MDVCHLVLGCLWQHDMTSIYNGRNNYYSFHWLDKGLELLPFDVKSDQVSVTEFGNSIRLSQYRPLAAYREWWCFVAILRLKIEGKLRTVPIAIQPLQ